jgi:L-cysteine:1D-myo-inositol 2-amino-2-deoxy-alpha-D-glucopyranoside ligase
VQAWAPVDVPALPGRGLPVRLSDTSAGAVRPTSPGPTARLYVCGITPYDATHLGHAATYVAFDLLLRAWRDAGHTVRYAQNVTDVDDPLLERAARDGIAWEKLADVQVDLFRDDMQALRVLPPDDYVGAVESIPLVVDLVQRLRAQGAVYELAGDHYFQVVADRRFGSVANLDTETMVRTFGERGGDPDRAGKREPLDPVLWLARRDGEPWWPSPLGDGRPGWHVECAAIALCHLGTAFDVQGGGSDLAFPHHEMCASIAQAATESYPFARLYAHAGMVGLDGAKMSKSQGNLVFVSRLRDEGADPMAVRLALLAHHYRDDWEWTAQDLPAATDRLARWRDAVGRAAGPPADVTLADVRAALADDLDAPRALRCVDRWAAETRLGRGDDPVAPGLVGHLVDALLGVALTAHPSA